MSNDNFMNFFNPDLTKTLAGLQGTQFDLTSFMESQRKNFQAINEAQQRTMEGLQTAMIRQGEMISQIIQENATIASELMNEASPEDKVARQAEIMKNVYEKTIRNMQDIGELLSKSNQDAAEVLNKRISASLNEIKAGAKKKAA